MKINILHLGPHWTVNCFGDETSQGAMTFCAPTRHASITLPGKHYRFSCWDVNIDVYC